MYRIGIVYSVTSAANFFDRQAYAQLFAAVQYQATMAGIPFDLLTETDLVDLDRLAGYRALVFPACQNVRQEYLAAINNCLQIAIEERGIGTVVIGNWLTNDESGSAFAIDPYQRMKELLGLQIVHSAGLQRDVVLEIDRECEGILGGVNYPEKIDFHDRDLAISSFDGYQQQPIVIASQITSNKRWNAVLATQTGGRNVHFCNEILAIESNLFWAAIQWSVYGCQPKVSLNLSRQPRLFATRIDADLSKYADFAIDTAAQLTSLLTEWHDRSSFVASIYLNIGDRSPQVWQELKSIYQQWLKMGYEIGTHSWHHPFSTRNLSAAELEIEFDRSRSELDRQLDLKVSGASIPGDPEDLRVATELSKYFPYYTGVGSSYRHAIGFLSADLPILSIAPNLDSDYHLVEFQHLDGKVIGKVWKNQFKQAIAGANCPIVCLPIHDYGILALRSDLYDRSIYPDTIALAAQTDCEFLTLEDLQHRYRGMMAANLEITPDRGCLHVNVSGRALGRSGLRINADLGISRVKGWYAYNADTIFVGDKGGNFRIEFGDKPLSVTRLHRLPQRAKLIDVVGNSRDLAFSFEGCGRASVILDRIDRRDLQVRGVDRYTLKGHRLELTCDRDDIHHIEIYWGS